jgi:hypothetical protein
LIALSTLLRWPAFLFWLAVAVAGGVLGSLLPLIETIGYEYALLSALICSMTAGHLAACAVSRARKGALSLFPVRSPVLGLYVQAATAGLIVAAVLLFIALVNGLRVGFCNLADGLLFFLLMPILSVTIASAVGLVSGLVTKGVKGASVVWFAVFLASLVTAFTSFYATPAVFIYHPFFGYYPGVLYDTLIEVGRGLVTYRIGTVCQVIATVGAASLLYGADLTIDPERLRNRVREVAVVALFIAAAIALQLAGPGLGHRTSRDHLEAELSYEIQTKDLALYFPEGTHPDLVTALTSDATFSLHQVKRYLGVGETGPIAVFFFKNSLHKKALIGAGRTNVAKPWRLEVYVTLETPPHPVLRHELVHAVSSALGRGPFAIAGELGGLLPNPGLIEGLATAAQGPRGDLTVHQWAAAMASLSLLPRADQIFGFGFFDLAARRAYTTAGSFCAWVREQYGAKALRDAYRRSSFEKATGHSLGQLESAWRRFLKTVTLLPPDLAAAKHKFDRPPVIRTLCVHEVARLNEEAEALREKGAADAATVLLEEAHERSGQSTATRQRLFFAAVDRGDKEEIREMAGAYLKDPAFSKVVKNTINEILADLDAAEARWQGLAGRYLALAEEAANDDTRRRLEVKAHLAALDGERDKRLFHVLAAAPGPQPVTPPLAALIIADAAQSRPEDPILAYLHARQYYNQQDFNGALERLERAQALGLPRTTPSLYLAARMIRAESMLQLGRLDEAQDAFQKIAKDPKVRLGARALAKDFADRARFLQTRRSSGQ